MVKIHLIEIRNILWQLNQNEVVHLDSISYAVKLKQGLTFRVSWQESHQKLWNSLLKKCHYKRFLSMGSNLSTSYKKLWKSQMKLISQKSLVFSGKNATCLKCGPPSLRIFFMFDAMMFVIEYYIQLHVKIISYEVKEMISRTVNQIWK